MEQLPECDPTIVFDEVSDYTDSDSDNDDFSHDKEDIIKKDRIRSGIDTIADLDQLKAHMNMNTMCVGADDIPFHAFTDIYTLNRLKRVSEDGSSSVNDTIAVTSSFSDSSLIIEDGIHGQGYVQSGCSYLTKHIFVKESIGVMRREFFRMVDEDSGRVIYTARTKKAGSQLIHIYQTDGMYDASVTELKQKERLVAVLVASLDYMTHRLVADQQGKQELAVIVFEKSCYHSERFHVICPPTVDGKPLPHEINDRQVSMVQFLRTASQPKLPEGYWHLCSKDPALIDGALRHSFNVRARVPSTRNFLVIPLILDSIIVGPN